MKDGSMDNQTETPTASLEEILTLLLKRIDAVSEAGSNKNRRVVGTPLTFKMVSTCFLRVPPATNYWRSA